MSTIEPHPCNCTPAEDALCPDCQNCPACSSLTVAGVTARICGVDRCQKMRDHDGPCEPKETR